MEALLTPEQVASRLRLTLHTVYVWLRAGRLPGTKLGHQWRVRPEDLEKYLEASRKASPPAPQGEEGDLMALVELAGAYTSQIPTAEWDRVPQDLCEHLDHYVYGLPKKDNAS